MLVNQILSMKPSGDIITVAPSVTVADAIRLLSEKRIGAVVVSEDGKTPLGILSERDVVRELGKRGVDVLTLTVSDLMTKKLITCTTGEDALAILERMTEGRFRHLPVVEDGKLVGMVSIGDVVKHRVADIEHQASEIRNYLFTT